MVWRCWHDGHGQHDEGEEEEGEWNEKDEELELLEWRDSLTPTRTVHSTQPLPLIHDAQQFHPAASELREHNDSSTTGERYAYEREQSVRRTRALRCPSLNRSRVEFGRFGGFGRSEAVSSTRRL